MTSSTVRTIEEEVRALVAEIVEIDPSKVNGATRMREDLGMDSLGSLELLSSLSERFSVDLELEEALGIVTVDDACTFLERCIAARRDISTPAHV
ncbi:MAG: acyl carrier protein [Sandaracinaceae bacterium]|jgi:acyl carrier protein|nr:acyl carrier protein [Sandaracinaceae bacterium]